jgi:pilus assembly protein Flp/PilA
MNALVSRMKAFLVNEDGPTATEYAVMLALIIIACMTAITLLSDQLQAIFNGMASDLQAETGY